MSTLAASVTEQVERDLDEKGYTHLSGLLTSKELADVRAALPADVKPTSLDDPRLDCFGITRASWASFGRCCAPISTSRASTVGYR